VVIMKRENSHMSNCLGKAQHAAPLLHFPGCCMYICSHHKYSPGIKLLCVLLLLILLFYIWRQVHCGQFGVGGFC